MSNDMIFLALGPQTAGEFEAFDQESPPKKPAAGNLEDGAFVEISGVSQQIPGIDAKPLQVYAVRLSDKGFAQFKANILASKYAKITLNAGNFSSANAGIYDLVARLKSPTPLFQATLPFPRAKLYEENPSQEPITVTGTDLSAASCELAFFALGSENDGELFGRYGAAYFNLYKYCSPIIVPHSKTDWEAKRIEYHARYDDLKKKTEALATEVKKAFSADFPILMLTPQTSDLGSVLKAQLEANATKDLQQNVPEPATLLPRLRPLIKEAEALLHAHENLRKGIGRLSEKDRETFDTAFWSDNSAQGIIDYGNYFNDMIGPLEDLKEELLTCQHRLEIIPKYVGLVNEMVVQAVAVAQKMRDDAAKERARQAAALSAGAASKAPKKVVTHKKDAPPPNDTPRTAEELSQ